MSASATRKSIKTHFPLGAVLCRGQDNPITLHSVNDDVFRTVWSLIAETMVVDGVLTRGMKETIAELVSMKNSCPVCVVAHSMMGVAAQRGDAAAAAQKRNNKKQQQEDATAPTLDEAAVLQYAEHIKNTSVKVYNEDCTEDAAVAAFRLSETAKAEIALVILLFEHMNRVVSALMGTEMSTAMFGVPRPVARTMEKKSVMGVMSKMMSPFLSRDISKPRKEGITLNLFRDENNDKFDLPPHLELVQDAGGERARALARWIQLDQTLHDQYLQEIVPPSVLAFLADPVHTPPSSSSGHLLSSTSTQRLQWILTEMRQTAKEQLQHPHEAVVAIVLLQVQHAPSGVYRSLDYKALVKKVGVVQARLVVIWWSMKVTLAEAKGLSRAVPLPPHHQQQ